MVFSHDSRQLALASDDGTVKIWDAETGRCMQTPEGHDERVNLVVFSHDSRQLASASDDGTVKIWHTEMGRCMQMLEGHDGSVNSVVFSHDSRQLASASCDWTVKIWDTETGRCMQTLEDHDENVNSVVFSHDSRQLTSASDETVKIWDAETGGCMQTLEGNGGWVNSVAGQVYSVVYPIAFDPTGSYLFTYRGPVNLDQSSSVRHIARGSRDAPMIGDTVCIPDGIGGLPEPQWRGYGLSSDRAWIAWCGKNLLWLHSEYRPGHFAISGATVVIRCGNGRIIVIGFSPAGPGSRHDRALEM